jgi:hypothetical protein
MSSQYFVFYYQQSEWRVEADECELRNSLRVVRFAYASKLAG